MFFKAVRGSDCFFPGRELGRNGSLEDVLRMELGSGKRVPSRRLER